MDAWRHSFVVACYHPITGYRAPGGKVKFASKGAFSDLPVTVACGQCIGCRLERSRQWAMRCMHEAQMHDENCFLTLTYDDESCPEDMSLDVPVLQKFMKRYRKKFTGKTIRYYACGEYGEKFLRPHYHLCVFGHDFDDKELHSIKRDNKFYRSETLEQLWPFGYSIISDLTFQSAAYVARYVMKKVTGKGSEDAYWRGDPETGECWQVKPEFNCMSKRPGVGYDWYKKYKSDVYPKDYLHVNGVKSRPPRYYDKLLCIDSEKEIKNLKMRRVRKAGKYASDNTAERLADREVVKLAALSSLKRTVE